MLEHLRQRIKATFLTSTSATLATHGPAGLLANVFPCVGVGTRLYLQLPRTSDHLVNLEFDPAVVVTTQWWQARGRARLVTAAEQPADLAPLTLPDARLYVTVEVQPTRVEIAHQAGWGAAETIDLDI